MNEPGAGLELAVQFGGCHGFQYEFTWLPAGSFELSSSSSQNAENESIIMEDSMLQIKAFPVDNDVV